MQLLDNIQLTASGPGGVAGGSAQVFGKQGIRSYYFWVVAHFPIGISISGPFYVRNAPQRLTADDYVLVVWEAAPGAIDYDVLRTETNQFPDRPGLYALRLRLRETFLEDRGGPLEFYDARGLPWGAPVSRNINLNNRDYQQPTIEFDAPAKVPQIQFPDGSVQDTAPEFTTDAPADGVLYGRQDNQWVPAVRLAGDTMTGPLELPGDPTLPLQAVPKQYVDGKLAVDEAPFDDNAYGRFHYGWIPTVKLLGDRMTGPLELYGNPVRSLEAATKQYVDQGAIAPNMISNLILWLAAIDRSNAQIQLADTTEGGVAGLPVLFDAAPMPDRTGNSSQNATGIGTIVPAWGGAAASTYLPGVSTTYRYFISTIGANRFNNAFTLLMLWSPYLQPLNPNGVAGQMTYRPSVVSAGSGPAIILYNPGGSINATGFAGFAYDGIGQTTPIFEIADWNSWYMVGTDGASNSSMKCRVNGVNSVPIALGQINSLDSVAMGWGNPGLGLMLEAVVYDRRLFDSEYLAIENYWKRKYGNILLGRAIPRGLESAGQVSVPLPPFTAPAPVQRKRAAKLKRRVKRFVSLSLEWARNTIALLW